MEVSWKSCLLCLLVFPFLPFIGVFILIRELFALFTCGEMSDFGDSANAKDFDDRG